MASASADSLSSSSDSQHVASFASSRPSRTSHAPRSASMPASMPAYEPVPKSSSSHIQWHSESTSQPATTTINSTWRSQSLTTSESISKSVAAIVIRSQEPPSPSSVPSISTSSLSISESSATTAISEPKSPTIRPTASLPTIVSSNPTSEASSIPAAISEYPITPLEHFHGTSVPTCNVSSTPVTVDIPPAPLLFGDHSLPYMPTLYDLKHALNLDRSSKQQDFRQSLQLHTHLMGLSLSTRLLHGLDSAYEQAHEAFKNKQRPDQRHAFVSVFNQAYEEAERTVHRALAAPQPRPSFLDRMTQSSSKAVLDFVHLLRTEPKVLARAFANMQAQELDYLAIPERSLSASQVPATTASIAASNVSSASKVGQATLSRGFSSPSTKPPSTRERSNSLFLHGSSGSQTSVFGSVKHAQGSLASPNTRPQGSAQGPPPASAAGPDIASIPNFMNNQDIVHVILESLFGPSSFEGETLLRRDLVAAIIVELLAERKGERLIGEFLERYLTLTDWQHFNHAKQKFEATILGIIQRGDKALDGHTDQELNAEMAAAATAGTTPLSATKVSLLGATGHQQGRDGDGGSVGTALRHEDVYSRRIGEPVSRRDTQPPILPRLTTRQSKVEGFFTEACLEILDCLQEYFPPTLLQLLHAIFIRIDKDRRAYATLVIVIKFVFYRFTNKCIAYPETYGLMQENFITEQQRQRILFTTHQRLYLSVTMIINPLPGWERRAAWIDPRLKEAVENFVDNLITPKSAPVPQYPLNLIPGTESVSPTPLAPPSVSVEDGDSTAVSPPTITPVLMLCPSDVTTLFYFVAPQLRTPVTIPVSSSGGTSSPPLARSNSFGGGKPQRHRTTSETPPLATRVAVNAASLNHPTGALPNPRAHKRSSASFSFFGSTAFKSKPPPPSTLERGKSGPVASDVSGGGPSSSSVGHHLTGPSPTLSAVRTSATVQPQMATIEVTTTTRIGIHPETGIATCPTTRATEVQASLPREGRVLKTTEDVLTGRPIRSLSPTPMVKPIVFAENWADDELLPAMKTAIQELKTIYPGPIKEVPWSLSKVSFDPLHEPWALVYVQYPPMARARFATARHEQEGNSAAKDSLAPIGLAMAPSCMAMVMENSAFGTRPRNVTVTTPILVDQGMDSAGNPQEGLSEGLVVDLDLDVDASDTDSILMPEDRSSNSMTSSTSLGAAARQSHDDHHGGHLDWSGGRVDKMMTTGQDILRVNSNQMLSSLSSSSNSGAYSSTLHHHPPPSSSYSRPPVSNGSVRRQQQCRDASPMARQRNNKELDLLWKQRMRQRVRSEYDLPEDVRTVAKALFRVLREFDIVPMDGAWIYPGRTPHREETSIRSVLIRAIDQARLYGSHAAAVAVHHAVSVLDSSPNIQALDDAKLVFLLSLPIYNRLQHRSERMRARISWEAYAHGWHQRVLAAIERRREDLSTLRIKMYYQTCVRPSKAFERSWTVVQVLSRLNHETLQKYMTIEELECERQRLFGTQQKNTGLGCSIPGIDLDDDEAIDIQEETGSRDFHDMDDTSVGDSNNMTRRRDSPTKNRRSSFSTYIDNMAARSYNGQVSFLESQMRDKERERERDRENEKTKKLSSSYTPSQHGSHLLNQYYHTQESPPALVGSSRHQPLHRTGSRQGVGNHTAGSGPRGWPVMFDKEALLSSSFTSSSNNSIANNTSNTSAPQAADFVMDAREASAAKKWIQDTGINDFMPGEDNFHRFCMEVELVVRGVGLGGTGILDAGIPQATQGQLSASLHSSGSDFFVKEVKRFNGAFVPGMAPPPELLSTSLSGGGGGISSSSSSIASSTPSTPTTSTFTSNTKSSTAVGVAEYLVNSFKGSSQTGSQPGGGLFSGSTSGSATSLQGGGGSSSGASSIGNITKSHLRIRKVAPSLHLASDDRHGVVYDSTNLPSLGEDDDSIFASTNPGPTYLLYNPPFASATAGPSSFYSSSTTPGSMSLVSLPHQAGQPIKDLDDLLLKIQLKLTSYVLSEWLDVFGEVETDRWFAEFMEDMTLHKSEADDGSEIENDAAAEKPQPSLTMSSRGMTSSSSRQQFLKSLPCSDSGTNIDLSVTGCSSNGVGDNRVSGICMDEHEGQSPSIGTMSRTSSGVSNISMGRCFTMVGVEAMDHGSSNGDGRERSSGSFAGALSDHPFPSTSSTRFHVSTDDMTPRASRADMAAPTSVHTMHFESGDNVDNREWATPTPLSMQQKPGSSGRSVRSHTTEHEGNKVEPYDVEEAVRNTIMQFEQARSPYQKLVHLFSLELLIVASLSYPASCGSGSGPNSSSHRSSRGKSIFDSMHSLSSLASEGDVDDSRPHHRRSHQKHSQGAVPKAYTPGTDAIVNAIEKLFRRPWPLRPQNLFRDMQLIATFVPGSILDLRDDGKAFWDMALAGTSLKNEVVEHLVKRGLELVETEEMAASSQGRADGNHGGTTGGGYGHSYQRNEEEERLRMREAVRLFTIGAKESHSVAQRELAILYMSLPAIPTNASYTARYTRAPGGRPQYHLQQQQRHHHQQHQQKPQQDHAKSSSPSSISTFRFFRAGGSGGTPSSPKSPSTTTMTPGTTTTTLSTGIPIKHSGSGVGGRARHQHRHSNSSGGRSGGIGGAASSFTGNVLSGLGIMAGLGAFAGGRDSGAVTGAGGGPSSAGSAGSFGSLSGGTTTVSAADPTSAHVEDTDHLHPSSATLAGVRLCSCGSEASSFGRHFLSHFTDSSGGSGGGNGSCPHHRHHHNHHRHTSSTSSNSSAGSFDRDRSAHHGQYTQHQQHPQHYVPPPPPPPPVSSLSTSSNSALEKFNPENVAAAMHWFTLAAAQGDKFSIEYLKHRDMASGMLK